MNLDPNDKYAYVIQWIEESHKAMKSRLDMCQRNLNAYNQIPKKNAYLERAKAFDSRKALGQGFDQERINMILEAQKTLPEGRSDIVFRTVETNVNQLSGGIGQFQTTLLDSASILEDNFEQKLALAAERIYNIYGLDKLRDPAVRDLMLYGATYFYPYYDDKLNDVAVEAISIDKMILDPIRYRRNEARYIGFHKMVSWNKLEKEVEFKKNFLKTINKAHVYAKNIQELMNNPNAQISDNVDELKNMIATIYPRYTSNATTNEGKMKQKYEGEDVELTYIWDLTDGTRFTVLNRKFIIDEKAKDLEVATTIENETSRETIKTNLLKRLKTPIIEIPYKVVSSYPFPITPLDQYMEEFDEICALVSMKKHNESLVGIVTPFGDSYDLALWANTPPISGIGVPGLDGQVGFLQKPYDPTFLDSRIEQKEQKIREAMSAFSQIDMAMTIGDRASAKEAGAAHGAVSAGHNSLIHNLEIGFAEIIRAVELLIVKHKSDKTIKIRINDDIDTVNIPDLAMDAILDVKLKSEVDRVRQQNSLMASQMMNMGVQNPYINQEVFVPKMLEIAFGSLLSRSELRDIIQMPTDKDQMALAQQEAMNQAQRLNLEQQIVDRYPEGRIGAMMNATMTPEDKELFAQELEQGSDEDIMSQAGMGGGVANEYAMPQAQDNPNLYNMNQEDMLTNIDGVAEPNATGMPPELAGQVSNGGIV